MRSSRKALVRVASFYTRRPSSIKWCCSSRSPSDLPPYRHPSDRRTSDEAPSPRATRRHVAQCCIEARQNTAGLLSFFFHGSPVKLPLGRTETERNRHASLLHRLRLHPLFYTRCREARRQMPGLRGCDKNAMRKSPTPDVVDVRGFLVPKNKSPDRSGLLFIEELTLPRLRWHPRSSRCR
jgi:hypothetical protein